MPQTALKRQITEIAFRFACLAGCTGPQHGALRFDMTPGSPLDNPETAAFAWARYKRLMRWMVLVTAVAVTAALYLLYRSNGFVSVHFYIATALGIGFAMLLTSALMGLVFLSSGTGHDEAIISPLDDDI